MSSDRTGAAPVRVRLDRTAAEPFDLLQARHGLQDDSDAGEVVELLRDVDRLLDEHAATGEGPEPLLVADDDPRGRVLLRGHDDGTRFALNCHVRGARAEPLPNRATGP
jgi:hypothetical protein